MKNILVILLISIVGIMRASDFPAFYLKTAYIEGATNVNKFYFVYESITGNSIVNFLPHSDLAEIDIPVKEFKGDNPMMLSDFQKLLKSSEHPYVKVNIDKNMFKDIVDGKIESQVLFFTIAGVKKEVKTNFSTREISESSKVVSGSACIHLTDFSLEPPEKLMGIIQVKDIVFIKFDIIFTEGNLKL